MLLVIISFDLLFVKHQLYTQQPTEEGGALPQGKLYLVRAKSLLGIAQDSNVRDSPCLQEA